MRVTREQMAEHRRRILEAAGRLFRERGFESVTVSEVMGAAGLTHGGFYGHFRSKDELIAEALAAALAPGEAPCPTLADFADAYLTPRHRDNRAAGCPTAALATEAIRQTAAARSTITAALRRHVDQLASSAPGTSAAARRRAAIGSWSAMLGAVILARLYDDPALSDEVLRETRAWIDGQSPGTGRRRRARGRAA